MLYLIRFFLGFGLLVTSLSVTAGVTAWTKVTQVNSGYPGGEIYLVLEDSSHNPAGCASVLHRHDRDPDKTFSLLMAALVSDREVSVTVSSTECSGNYRVANQIRVR